MLGAGLSAPFCFFGEALFLWGKGKGVSSIDALSVWDNRYSISVADPLPSASLIESGSSVLLVSGSRKQRAPLIIEMLLKMMVGMDGWYTSNTLISGDTKPPTLHTMLPIPEAVCLTELYTDTHGPLTHS